MATPTPTPTDSGSCCRPGGSCGKCPMDKIVLILVLIGGINWGLVGLGGFLGKNLNVVNLLLGGVPTLEYVVYILVGLAALKEAVFLSKCCKK